MVICQGCGHAFEIPAGYSRNKIQCPGCGVICTVPADEGRQHTDAAPRPGARKAPMPRREPEPAIEDQAAGWLAQPDPPPAQLFDDEPAPLPAPAPKAKAKQPVKPQEMLYSCRRCGRQIRKQRECPSCDGAPDIPVQQSPPASTSAPLALELEEPGPDNTDEDASPYLLADKDLPTCPKCRKVMEPGSVLCASCGFDQRTRKKTIRTYETIARSWDCDIPFQTRLMYLGAAQGIHWLLALMLLASGNSAWPFVVTWPFLTAILCFVLGTYDRIDLDRDHKGRVKLTKQWRFCFFPLMPVTTEIRGFEGVTTGQWHDAGPLEWFIFFFLLFMAVIPALIFWYNAIHKQHFHVALARDHGHAEVWVYRGRDQDQMNEIADVLCNASGLRRIG
jgi:hypothetical protein